MNKTALLISIALSLIGVGLMVVYKIRFEAEFSGGPPTVILAASKDIDIGMTLTRDMLVTRTVPQNYVESRHVLGADIENIVGVKLRSEIRAGDSLLWSDLATSRDQHRDLANLVRGGMRAVSVTADNMSSFGGLLKPGDRVDVLLTVARNQSRFATTRLLQNVLVLAIGGQTGVGVSDNHVSGNSNEVTLSASVENAQLLTSAMSTGRLTLVLRNHEDVALGASIPESVAEDKIKSVIQLETQGTPSERNKP